MNKKVKPDKFHRIPMPIDLRPSIRNTCKAFDKSNRVFLLNGEEINLIDFFEANVDTLPADSFYEIFSMEIRSGDIDFGGGAAPVRTLKRVR